MNRNFFILLLMIVVSSAAAWGAAAEPQPLKPGEKDKCPVCGMFVHKYPDWVGQVSFTDGSTVFFDGAKDLFKYYFRLAHYNPGKSVADIAAMWVTEYYDMVPVAVRSAFFVVGSDVFGPMGKELIPFGTADAAEEFRKDHGGSAILSFDRITAAVIEDID